MRGAGASGARHKVSSVFVWCLPSVELRPFAVQWLARIPQYSVLRLVKRDPSVVCRLSSVPSLWLEVAVERRIGAPT